MSTTAYYLVHSMGATATSRSRTACRSHFAAAAREAGVRRIVYLGGLGAGGELSTHLASRQEVGRILADSGVPTIEFRASIVIGSGSLSFEMIRTLVERLPVMVTPRWVRTVAQPIAIEDVLAYLVAALDVELDGSAGLRDRRRRPRLLRGADARVRPPERPPPRIIPVPLLTARLSSLWLGLVTPVYARVGRKLIESLPHETVVRSTSADRAFPIRPRGYREAIARALANEDREFAETRWSDAVSSAGLVRSATGASATASVSSTRARIPVPVPPPRRSGRSAGSAARRAGTSPTGSGGCAASSTCSSAASACAVAGAIPRSRRRDRRSTSGASRRTSRTGCSGCTPR